MAMNDSEILESRRQARAAKQHVDAGLIELHRTAVRALLDANQGEKVRQRALEQVAKWDHEHLCSSHYIQAWQTILNSPTGSMESQILRNDVEGIALRQNSPFGFLLARGV